MGPLARPPSTTCRHIACRQHRGRALESSVLTNRRKKWPQRACWGLGFIIWGLLSVSAALLPTWRRAGRRVMGFLPPLHLHQAELRGDVSPPLNQCLSGLIQPCSTCATTENSWSPSFSSAEMSGLTLDTDKNLRYVKTGGEEGFVYNGTGFRLHPSSENKDVCFLACSLHFYLKAFCWVTYARLKTK